MLQSASIRLQSCMHAITMFGFKDDDCHELLSSLTFYVKLSKAKAFLLFCCCHIQLQSNICIACAAEGILNYILVKYFPAKRIRLPSFPFRSFLCHSINRAKLIFFLCLLLKLQLCLLIHLKEDLQSDKISSLLGQLRQASKQASKQTVKKKAKHLPEKWN